MNYRLTHPDKVLYPEKDITKQDIANYYESIQKFILPYIINRPLTLVRCPQGWEKKCFYQKHLTEKMPGLYPINIKEKEGTDKYIYIKDLQGLMALVQLGVLEIHLWNCHVDAVEKPDMMIFDLDPAPNLAWKKVIDTAFLIREKLTEIRLKSFVKTTGGKGLHVVVPLKRGPSWQEVKDFSESLVNTLVQLYPNEFVATMTKSKRKGKIFIDYHRNQRGATSVAPYSTRARENAPIAMPLSWDELSTRIKSNSFTIASHWKKDAWSSFFKVKQSLITV